MKNLFTYQTPIEKLSITNEDISGVLNSLYSGLGNKLSSFKETLLNVLPLSKEVFSESKKQLELTDVSLLDKDQKNFLKIVNQYSYSEIKNLKAYTPEGMNCTYLEMLDTLSSEVTYISEIEKNILNPFEVFLSKLVSNKKELLSLDTKDIFYKKMNDRREDCYKDFSKLYLSNSTNAISIVGKVIDRNNDWETIFNKLNDQLKILSNIDRKKLQNSVTQIEVYIDSIISNIESDDVKDVSPEVIKQITNSTYQIAKELEYFSYIYFKVLTIKGSVENTVEHIKTVYK